jgi:hypothetical protein
MKTLPFATVTVICTLIVACSGNNPLQSQPPKEAAKFIFDASSAAQDVIDTSMTRMAGGYEACMLDEVKDKSYCKKLYKLMIKYAENTDSVYRDISVAQLTNQKAYENFKKYLANAMFG